MNANQKGKRGEREWRDQLREVGFEARRGQQYCGAGDSPDVQCDSLPSIWWEVKRTESLSLYTALEQAATDAKHRMPVVAHKRNNRPWVCILPAKDFLEILRRSDLVASKNNASEDGDFPRAY